MQPYDVMQRTFRKHLYPSRTGGYNKNPFGNTQTMHQISLDKVRTRRTSSHLDKHP